MRKILYTSLLIILAAALMDNAECTAKGEAPLAKRMRGQSPERGRRDPSSRDMEPSAKRTRMTPQERIRRDRSSRDIGPSAQRMRMTPQEGTIRDRSSLGGRSVPPAQIRRMTPREGIRQDRSFLDTDKENVEDNQNTYMD